MKNQKSHALKSSAKAIVFSLAISLSLMACNAQTLDEIAEAEIDTLETLIAEAELAGIDVLRERLAIRTAEIFRVYANWDEAHVVENTTYFGMVARYRDDPAPMAEGLADFERNDIITMLNDASSNLRLIIDGEIVRKPTPDIDWAHITNDGDQLTYEDRPVFIADYTWKTHTDKLKRYHGNLDGFFITPSHLENDAGTINSAIVNDLNTKPDGTLGFIFFSNKNVPQWTMDKFGEDFSMREDTYTTYDIDNPGAREMQELLLAGVVPKMAGKKYSELGYMLCNEPHFYTSIDGDTELWASGPVSEYTKVKFRTWLSNKHVSIDDLNTLWGTTFFNFDSVKIDIPIDLVLRGTPKWYDWVYFNNSRVTEWYKFVKAEIQKHDPAAKIHLKIMPNLWSENNRNHGIDLEDLTEISGIIGNDAGSESSRMFGETPWDVHYSYMWRELYMSYDFMKSVNPNTINFNSENHFLSTGKYRDLYNDPLFVRSVFWAATTVGLNASQIWYWLRNEDGSPRKTVNKSYAGSCNMQPRVTNEVHSTLMDLNSYSEEITAMQHQRKPLRIFYSKTSAFNKEEHMDDVFELYEDLNFEGISLGFATKNIISKQDNSLWEAILVYKTQFVTQAELDGLQTYLDNGGTIIMDAVSLKKNEYGAPLDVLVVSNGTVLTASSLSDMKTKALGILSDRKLMPEISIIETNTGGHKGCTWKCIVNDSGKNVVSIVNLGKTNATLNIVMRDTITEIFCKDLLRGKEVSSSPVLKPYEVYFAEISIVHQDTTDTTAVISQIIPEAKLYPNPSEGNFYIDFSEMQDNVDLRIYSMNGSNIFRQKYSGVSRIASQIGDYTDALYIIEIISDLQTQRFKYIKY